MFTAKTVQDELSAKVSYFSKPYNPCDELGLASTKQTSLLHYRRLLTSTSSKPTEEKACKHNDKTENSHFTIYLIRKYDL